MSALKLKLKLLNSKLISGLQLKLKVNQYTKTRTKSKWHY